MWLTLSVVRYRYNAAQVKLAEILRQELNESDDERNDSFSVDNDSFECEDIVEVNDDVPDELDEAGVLAVQLSLHQFATW